MKKFFTLICLLNPFIVLADESRCAAAVEFVRANSENVVQIIQSRKSDSELSLELEKVFLDVMDVDWIGKFVIGPAWRSLKDEQKIEYLSLYRKFLLSSYVPLFKEYNGQSMRIDGSDIIDAKQCMVNTLLVQKDGKSAAVSVKYRLKDDGQTFKVHDIVAEGVSLLSTQRSEFGSIMANQGFGGLLAKLKKK